MLISLFLSFLSSPASAWNIPVKEVVTPSGIKAWLVEDHSLPVVAVEVVFTEAGTASDPKGLQGRASMGSDMLLEGAGKYSAAGFAEALEGRAISMGFSVSEDRFNAEMNTLSEHKKEAFELLALALTKPKLEASAVERVRGQTQVLLKRLAQSPDYQLGRAWKEAAFGEHPYAQAGSGTESSVRRMTRADVQNYLRRYLTRENMVIGVAGDISESELSALLETSFKALPEKFSPERSIAEVKEFQGGRKHLTREIPQTIVSFGANGLKRDHPDFMKAYVMNYLLGGGGALNSVLGEEIRLKRGLAYHIGTELQPMRHAGLWAGNFATRNDQFQSALDVLRKTLSDVRAQGFEAGKMADAKRYLTGSFVLNLDRNGALAGYLTEMQVNSLGRDYLEKRNAQIEAVTKEDAERMLRTLIDPEKLLIVTLGPDAQAHGQTP